MIFLEIFSFTLLTCRLDEHKATQLNSTRTGAKWSPRCFRKLPSRVQSQVCGMDANLIGPDNASKDCVESKACASVDPIDTCQEYQIGIHDQIDQLIAGWNESPSPAGEDVVEDFDCSHAAGCESDDDD